MIATLIFGTLAVLAVSLVAIAAPGVIRTHRRARAWARFLREHPDFVDALTEAARGLAHALAALSIPMHVAAERFTALGEAMREAEAAQRSIDEAFASTNAAAAAAIQEQL